MTASVIKSSRPPPPPSVTLYASATATQTSASVVAWQWFYNQLDITSFVDGKREAFEAVAPLPDGRRDHSVVPLWNMSKGWAASHVDWAGVAQELAACSGSNGFGAALDCSAAMWSSTAVGGAVDFAGLTGCTIQPTILGSGSHQIVLTYTDPDTGVKSTAKRELEMTTVTDFVAQIVSPAKTGAPVFLFDQTLTLGAQAINGTDVTYQWSVTVGTTTVSVPGSTPTVPFTFAVPLTEICAGQTGEIDLIATNGADGTQVHDSEQFLLLPSAAFATHCTQ